MPAPAHIDLNATPVAGGLLSDGTRKHTREMSADMLSSARNLFDRMLVAIDDERANHFIPLSRKSLPGINRQVNWLIRQILEHGFIQSIIFKGAPAVARGAGYDLDETQSQDSRGEPFTPSTYDQAGMQPTFVQDQVGLDLDGFPLDHVFSNDYGLEEEDEVDIDGEPLFEDELATQVIRVQP
ncbi:Eyes absent-like protein 4 [Hordeum vulgare]|nr:Eyes absent-like protein 4 [Hordeum vulgare]